MKRKLENLIFGISFTAYGIYTLFQEGDFLIFRGAKIHRLTYGSIFLVIGFFALLMYYLKRPGPSDQEFVMCIKCKESFYRKDAPNATCPKCGGTIENMNGIFDRHPELQSNNNNKT
jgi:hypothetical protein